MFLMRSLTLRVLAVFLMVLLTFAGQLPAAEKEKDVAFNFSLYNTASINGSYDGVIKNNVGFHIIHGYSDKLSGIHYGFVNVIRGSGKGMQYGSFNIARGDMAGIQTGLVNTVGKDMAGVQLAGFNIARGKMTGVQVGLVNRAKKAKGLSLGLIGVYDELEALPLNLISIVKKDTQVRIQAWHSDTGFAISSVIFGGKHIYNMLSYGVYPKTITHTVGYLTTVNGNVRETPRILERSLVVYGWGVGIRGKLFDTVNASVDCSVSTVDFGGILGQTMGIWTLNRLMVETAKLKGFSLFGGATLNYYRPLGDVDSWTEAPIVDMVGADRYVLQWVNEHDIEGDSILSRGDRETAAFWPGFVIGIQLSN